jgi:membrane-anchored protein YejM (alkaline phosphatase superfamily)
MYLTVFYKNGIVEEFTLGLNSAKDLIKRLIDSKLVTKIMSDLKVIFEEEKHDNSPQMEQLKQLHKDAEFWFNVAELDIVDGNYFPVDPMKKKTSDTVRNRNKKVKQQNFFSAKEKLIQYKNEYLKIMKEIAKTTSLDEKREIVKGRIAIEKMIKNCDSFIEILAQ